MIACTNGLDTVDLFMRVEECFGISIADSDACGFRTMGQLFDCVRKMVPRGSSSECLTMKAFYRVRRSFMSVAGCERKSVRLESLVTDIFPDETIRRTQWADLERDIGVRLPPLQRPATITLPLFCCVLLSILGGIVGIYMGWYRVLLAFGLSATILPLLICCLTRHRAVYIDLDCAGLSRIVMEKSFSTVAEQGASDQQVWEALVTILSTEAGIERSQITRDLRFNDIPGDLPGDF